MAADLDKLDPVLKVKLVKLLSSCSIEGVVMRPSTGLRDAFEQGRLWRQSRSKEEISAEINFLKQNDAHFLAHCIESVGPQDGKHVTNAVPGLSWHQWGEAVDCFWLLEGKAEWSVKKLVNGKNGYKVMANLAVVTGLNPGGLWSKFKDWPHIQLSQDASPLKRNTYSEIDKIMKERFGG